MKILAIETSCDETAAAVTQQTAVLSNVIASQIELHRRFGGVVPEIASRNHTLAIRNTVEEALTAAGVGFADIDAVAVTQGSGLLGALLVGVSYAKALAYALKKPLFAVNHILGHIAANHIESPALPCGTVNGDAAPNLTPCGAGLTPPYICLIASGGHTAVAKVTDFPGVPGAVEILGQTQDDAAGEAFDKIARAMGLPYPGGPEIERLARLGKPVIELPHPLKAQKGFDFSFSGLKTAVINKLARGANPADLAASFQKTAVTLMANAAVRAARAHSLNKIVIAGGVAANTALRASLQRDGSQALAAAPLVGLLGSQSELNKHTIVYYPQLKYCTDNAAMIGVCAYFMAKAGVKPATLELDAATSVTAGKRNA